MKNGKRVVNLIVIFILVGTVVWSAPKMDRPRTTASPLDVLQLQLLIDDQNSQTPDKPKSLYKTQDAATALQDGGDRLVALQNNDGGWDWPLDDSDPDAGSAVNTVAPIAMGLAQAYFNTRDADQRAALIDAGSFLLAKSNNFSPSDGYLAAALDDIFGGSTYTNHVKTYFYDQLAAGTYDRKGEGTLYDTEAYVNQIRTDRSGDYANMAAWDIGIGLVGAASVGASTSEWIAGTKAEIDELDGDKWYDVLGLAGAIYGLAFVGEDFDPSAGEHAAASSLSDLADILVSYQINNGGFSWNSNYLNPGEGNETIQETAYAILALNKFNRSTYITNIQGASAYLIDVQLPTGGWENYSASGENNEITGEALWGISAGENLLIAVELTSFSARVLDRYVMLFWSTATETENLGFLVYRSNAADGDYAKISHDLITGAGSSDSDHSYSYIDREVAAENTYYYKLADVDFSGNITFHGPISVTVESQPMAYALEQNYPNPFNPFTMINFTVGQAGKVTLKIYNLQGNLVSTLVDSDKGIGSHSVLWNGTDDNGGQLASGVYYYTLKVNGFEETKRLTLMK